MPFDRLRQALGPELAQGLLAQQRQLGQVGERVHRHVVRRVAVVARVGAGVAVQTTYAAGGPALEGRT